MVRRRVVLKWDEAPRRCGDRAAVAVFKGRSRGFLCLQHFDDEAGVPSDGWTWLEADVEPDGDRATCDVYERREIVLEAHADPN